MNSNIRTITPETYQQGLAFLKEADPDLKAVLQRFGPPPLWDRPQGFASLLKIILEQQVSLASAQAAFDKLGAELGEILPQSFIKLGDEKLKQIGFSRQKTRYGRILARALLDGELDLDELPNLEDDQVHRKLTSLTGIGPWTADIYQLMVLLRADIWPRGDLALAEAMRQVKHLPERPSNDEMSRIAEKWKPWRALAARILWHHYLSV